MYFPAKVALQRSEAAECKRICMALYKSKRMDSGTSTSTNVSEQLAAQIFYKFKWCLDQKVGSLTSNFTAQADNRSKLNGNQPDCN